MVLTIGFISENFHKFNKEYFNDELQTLGINHCAA